MQVKSLCVGRLRTNCYFALDEDGACAVIDPGGECGRIAGFLREHELGCAAIFITHGHPDHTGAAAELSAACGSPVYITREDLALTAAVPMFRFRPPELTQIIRGGDTVRVGSMEFFVLSTPGHSCGSVSLICEDALFTGDTLLYHAYGRTDLPGGSDRDMRVSLTMLSQLRGDYRVFPGHGRSTSLTDELADGGALSAQEPEFE